MNILYEDDYLIVAFKEAKISSQKDKTNSESLEQMLEKKLNTKLHIITRLDKTVMGLSLFAKNKEIANKLTKMLTEDKIKKTYHAIIDGLIPEENKIESYILKDSRLNLSKIVNKGNVGAKYALLYYKTLEVYKNYTKVEIDLKTGRHHQIRVQFASISNGLYGDTKYNKNFKHKKNVYPALCACKLEFNHPITNKKLSIKCDDNLNIKDIK